MSRSRASSGAKWEEIVGYSRAVRVGNVVHVAGTTAVGEDGQIVGIGDAYEQTKHILVIIEKALHELGAKITDITRTRMFVTNIDDWEAVGRAHGEVFRPIKPAATLVAIDRLINPEMLVEIEVDAVIDED